MWTSTWPGLAGFGVLPADGVHARPPYSTCRPGHLPRGSVPPGVPDEAVLLSPAPGGSPYILYGSPNEPPFFGPPPEPQIRQDLYGLSRKPEKQERVTVYILLELPGETL